MSDGLIKQARLRLRYALSFSDGALRRGPVALLLLLILSAPTPNLFAQIRKRPPPPAPQSEQGTANDELAKSRDQFVKLTKEYKQSLEQLTALYEKEVSQAEDRLVTSQELYAQGLLSKRDLEESERAVRSATAKVAETRQQMVAADARVAEVLLESEASEQMVKAPPLAAGKLIRTTTYIRYQGLGGWSLADAWKVERFFQQRFGRPLLVSAFGQSALHDRWGLDHRNAMDVAVNPESVEGQALMAFLRSNGIPFSAFRTAIPGSATGPHIHIGSPSHRTRPVSAIQSGTVRRV